MEYDNFSAYRCSGWKLKSHAHFGKPVGQQISVFASLTASSAGRLCGFWICTASVPEAVNRFNTGKRRRTGAAVAVRNISVPRPPSHCQVYNPSPPMPEEETGSYNLGIITMK
jgi:hypothetical protein